MDEDKIVGVDTALINDGKFQFSGKEYLNDIGILSIGNYPEKVIYQPVFLEKGNISVSMDEKKLGGTNLNDLYHSYNYRMNKYTNEFQEISKLDKNKNYVKPGSPKDKKHIEIGIYSVNLKKNNINNLVGQYFFEKEAGKIIFEGVAYPSKSMMDSAFFIVYNVAPEKYKQNSG